MDTRKAGKVYVTCPKCGQGVRSEERLEEPYGSVSGHWPMAEEAFRLIK